MIASGTFHADGSFIPAALFQPDVLRDLFEAYVYKLLVSKELIGPDLITKMRSWKHSGFHVYVAPSIPQKEDALRVGLYIVRAPASASRLQLTEDGLLKYLAKGSMPSDRCDFLFEPAGQILDYLEWIAKVTSHIPEKGAQLVHYYGAYSNAHRGKKAKLAASAIGSLPHSAPAVESETEWIRLRRKSWAALIRLVYESDPLLCPKCQTQMKIISVIKDGAAIDKILAHLQYKFEQLPLALVRPPPDLRLSGIFPQLTDSSFASETVVTLFLCAQTTLRSVLQYRPSPVSVSRIGARFGWMCEDFACRDTCAKKQILISLHPSIGVPLLGILCVRQEFRVKLDVGSPDMCRFSRVP